MLQRFSRVPGLAVASALVCVAGCSSDDSRIYDAFKCGNVAQLVGQSAQAATAVMKVKPLLDKKTGNPGQYMLSMKTKLTDEMALFKLSPRGQSERVREIYESGTCQKLYE